MPLSSQNRLSNPEIKNVFKKGKSLASEFFQIKFIPAPAGIKKFAFVIGLKISKKAAIRNKIKRRTSEIIRLNISKIKPGHFVIIVAKSQVASKNYRDLEKDLTNNLARINRWTNLQSS